MELLIVEDEPVIGKALRQGLSRGGAQLVWAKDGDKGWELARSQQFDAIILDLMLPGKLGAGDCPRPPRGRDSHARRALNGAGLD